MATSHPSAVQYVCWPTSDSNQSTRIIIAAPLMLCLCGFLIAPGEGEGEGWTFAPAAIEPMVAAVSSAVNLFRDEPDKWKALQLRGMARDSSWERAAQQYEQVG